LVYVPRSRFLRERPVWEGRDGMRKLGERNLEIFMNLHEATLHFFNRHFRKLQRHVESLNIEGVPNFLHIFLSMGGLLRAQVERAVLGFEAKSEVSGGLWAECRDLWDVYFYKLRDLMEFLWQRYLSRMTREYGHELIQQQ